MRATLAAKAAGGAACQLHSSLQRCPGALGPASPAPAKPTAPGPRHSLLAPHFDVVELERLAGGAQRGAQLVQRVVAGGDAARRQRGAQEEGAVKGRVQGGGRRGGEPPRLGALARDQLL